MKVYYIEYLGEDRLHTIIQFGFCTTRSIAEAQLHLFRKENPQYISWIATKNIRQRSE